MGIVWNHLGNCETFSRDIPGNFSSPPTPFLNLESFSSGRVVPVFSPPHVGKLDLDPVVGQFL